MEKAYSIVDTFEKTIARYAGSQYAVAVDSCCNALFLCCKYLEVKDVYLPKYTYPGVACSVINAGGKVKFDERKWTYKYSLEPYPIVDSALHFDRDMYLNFEDSFMCLSFHIKKSLPIGRGGMILTNNKWAYDWFKKARFDGRNQCSLETDNIETVGWNMYMTPEQAVRGLMLFEVVKDRPNYLSPTDQGYPDLSKIKAYQ